METTCPAARHFRPGIWARTAQNVRILHAGSEAQWKGHSEIISSVGPRCLFMWSCGAPWCILQEYLVLLAPIPSAFYSKHYRFQRLTCTELCRRQREAAGIPSCWCHGASKEAGSLRILGDPNWKLRGNKKQGSTYLERKLYYFCLGFLWLGFPSLREVLPGPPMHLRRMQTFCGSKVSLFW